MYFDLQPKNRRADLYDFENQLGQLLELLRGPRARVPLITVIGPRRTGKTSLVKTALTESGLPHLTLNGMAFAEVPVIKKRSLLLSLERELNETIEREKGWGKKLLGVLDGIRWLKVNSKPPFVHFEWKRPKDVDLIDLAYSFNRLARESRTKFILVLDEAQEFRRLVGYSLQKLMAHIYDNVEGIQMIVTGSQVGFLHDFLGVDDSESPLYGRGTADIQVPRITRDLAADFLEKGFKQTKIEPDADVINHAIEKLDGIIGWLTFFGAKSVERGSATEEELDEAIKRGSELAIKELKNFLMIRRQASGRYVQILRSARSRHAASWTNLKEDLELQEKKHIANNVFSDLVENLVKSNFLQRNENSTYSIADPLLAHGLRRGYVKLF